MPGVGAVISRKGIVASAEINSTVFPRIQNPGAFIAAMLLAKHRKNKQIGLLRNLQFIASAQETMEVIILFVKPRPEIGKIKLENLFHIPIQ